MGHREVKRVPMDFDAPLKQMWQGYRMPDDVRLPECGACEGSGYSPTARWLQATFYAHNVRDGLGGWGDKLTQLDVDTLVEAGRLRHLVSREPTEDNPRKHEWVTVPRTADEVNAANGPGGSMLGECNHDSINFHILADARCERLGAESRCSTCGGHGMLGTDEERERYENWVGTEPPEGEGWQLWETTSEGSPVSPVFATARELADWCETGATIFGSERMTAEQWLASFDAGTTEVDSMLIVRT